MPSTGSRSLRFHRAFALLFLAALLLTPGVALAGSTSAELSPASDAYQYPIRPGTPEWVAFTSHEEMVRATDVDPTVLAGMSDEGLIRTVLTYPLLGDVLAFNSLRDGFDAVASRFSGLRELLERDRSGELLLRRYQRTDASAVPIVLSLEEQGRRARDVFYLELLLAQPEIQDRMGEALLDDLLVETLNKREQKLDRFDVYGLTGIERTAFTAAHALERVGALDATGTKLESFVETGHASSVATLDAIFAQVEERVLGEASVPLARRTGLATKDYYDTVYTPKGSAVQVIVMTWELSSADIAAGNAWVEQNYPNATRMTNTSRRYNCHSYAWYLKTYSNTRWMNTPGDDTYWQDGSYYSASSWPGRRVSYVYDDHSAVIVSDTWYESKWGQYPVMQHAPTYSPYNSSSLQIYRKAPNPIVNVTGPSTRDPNQSGTWTCSASGGEGPYTYSWFKSWDNGGYQELGTGPSVTTSHSTSFNIVCDVLEAHGAFLDTDYQFVDVDGPLDGPIFQ